MTESHPRPGVKPASHPLRPVIFLVIVFGVWLAIVASRNLWIGKELVPWQSDLAAAQTEAHSSNKPVLLYFTASWCGPCQEMRRSVWTDKQVAAAASKFVPVKIDIDQNEKLASQYRVESVPLLLVLDDAGQPVRALAHGVDAAEMEAWLTSANLSSARP